MNFKYLKNSELDSKIKSLAFQERELLHEILLAIKEIDSRKLYLELGYANLFLYLTESIGYSAGSAQRRIDAARLLKQVPSIGEKIQSGEIKLNQISLVQKAAREISKRSHIQVSGNDKKEILNQIINKDQKESEELVASFFDLPIQSQNKEKAQSDGSVRLEITLSKEIYAKPQKAQGLMAHSVGSREIAEFINYVSDKIIQQKTKQIEKRLNQESSKENRLDENSSSLNPKKTETKHLKQPTATVAVNHLSCQYQDAKTHKKCQSTWYLQTDHIIPKWSGKIDNTKRNLQILCASHNQHKYRREANMVFK